MKFDWKNPQTIRQKHFLLSQSLSERFFFQRKSIQKLHLYRPWSDDINCDLMFKVKKCIHKNSECFLPLIDIKGHRSNLNDDDLKQIQSQLSRGQETQLIMFNGHVIHILKISKICSKQEFGGELITPFKDLDFDTGVIVNDIYVFYANHLEHKNMAYKKLKELVSAAKETPFFGDEKSGADNLNNFMFQRRAFTYDYFVCSNELKEFVFKDNWDHLSLITKHELVQVEMCKREVLKEKGHLRWQLNFKAMEFLSQAFLSELSATYIYPLKQIAKEFPFFDTVVKDLTSQIQDEDFKLLVERIFLHNDGPELVSLDDFSCYIKNVKFFLYSVNSKISRAFHNEEFLWVENFLNYYQGLCESLLTKNLIDKIQMLADCQDWFFMQNNNVKKLDLTESEALNLKAAQLLRLLSTPEPEENLFFLLLEIKTEKAASKKSVQAAVHEILNEGIEKLVS